MKILFIHTFYQIKGGEDNVFQQEFNLFKQVHNTKSLIFNNKSGVIGFFQFIFSVYNFISSKKLASIIKKYHPDIIHIHNFHYSASPTIIRTARSLNIPVVLTIHNYRLLCPSGSLMDNGEIFTDSVNSSFPWKAIQKKVFHNSYLMTFWLAFVVWFHKRIGTWNLVDRYIVLSEFAKDLFVSSSLGVPSEKFVVKPNFVTQPISYSAERKPHFLFIGRLSQEKGIEVLLNTFLNSHYTIKIAGDGPLVEKVKKVSEANATIHYLGILNKEEVIQEMQQCQALIFPSIWYEGMPMTIIEAFSLGTPVIASNLGAMASMIQDGYNGFHFTPGDSDSLLTMLDKWSSLTDVKKQLFYKNALDTYRKNYTPEANYEMLMDIYQAVIDSHAKTKQPEAIV
ncbi:glycosyltransferase [Spirosoma sp. SC4-14]|uniref:glycosyltransferase n=1 Tax=Spirosoma sp. SC4-14 TaxID=3128900 RepID=UPI0030CD91AC